MTDTLWADISEFQSPVTDAYPYHFLSFRSNDGTYQDHHFAANMAWTKHAVDTNKLIGFMTYFVYEPNWQDTLNTFKAMVGSPHPKMAVMIDLESWGGRIHGDQSAALNALRTQLTSYLGNKNKVVGYGNAGDLESLWVNRSDIKIVLANYGSNPTFPNKLAHQFSDHYAVAPFGYCDINSADGYSPQALATALGFGTPVVITKPPAPAPAGADTLLINHQFHAGQSLTSRDGTHRLVLQPSDGNLVVYNLVTRKPIWSSGTYHNSGDIAVFQTDGNFVIYNAAHNKAIWDAHSQGKGGVKLVMQGDGNLVIYTAANKPVWSSLSNGH